jgi:hypothetical protein
MEVSVFLSDHYLFSRLLQRPGHLAGTQATGADVDPFYRALMDGLDPLQVGTPPFEALVVGMTDIVSYLVAFAANATYLGHDECSFLLTPGRVVSGT